MSDAAAAVSRLTGRAVTGERRLSGALTEAVLDGGDVVLVKRGHAPGATAAEAAGLRWLAEPAVVPIPVVHGHDEHWLVLDRIDTGRPDERTAERLGRNLAALHAAGAPAFGSPPPDAPAGAWIGLAPMDNTPGPDWPEWYAEHRVRPYVRLARDEGTLTADEAGVFDRVCHRLPLVSGPPERPSRLHGDLWNGNAGVDAEPRVPHRPRDPRRPPRNRPGDAALVRLPPAGPGPRRLRRNHAPVPRLARTDRAAPAVPALGARGPVRPLVRHPGFVDRPRIVLTHKGSRR